jgi:glucosamine-6-phosphate deaminase
MFQSPHKAARALAREIVRAVSHNPRLVLGLPTGRTSIQLYREIVKLSQSDEIDFSRATTFNLDEFLALSSDDRGATTRSCGGISSTT